MKKKLSFFALLLLCTVTATSYLKAQGLQFSVCIHDVFGYVWNGLSVTHEGNEYISVGTVQIEEDDDDLWRAKMTYNTHTGITTFKAVNPDADGCASGYTDYFTYDGVAKAELVHGALFYGAKGTWKSFCSGSVVGSGTWTATDCAQKSISRKINGPAKHADASLIRVHPNPVNGLANISYSVAQSGKVNISVYNSMSQTAKVLVNDFKNAGNYSAVWDTRSGNVTAGVYRLVAVVNGKTYSTTIQVIR